MTKVVALCGSARMENSNTAKILKLFLEGMEEAGADARAISKFVLVSTSGWCDMGK